MAELRGRELVFTIKVDETDPEYWHIECSCYGFATVTLPIGLASTLKDHRQYHTWQENRGKEDV